MLTSIRRALAPLPALPEADRDTIGPAEGFMGKCGKSIGFRIFV